MRQAENAAGPNSYATGKFFAESGEHALQWGKALEGAGNFRVVEAEFPNSVADQFMRWERLDRIGPARFGAFEQLGQPTIKLWPGSPVNHIARVLLQWLVVASTGQSPRGARFSVPARFDHQGDDWTADAWSLIIETEGTPDENGQQFAMARFLVQDAPHDWLAVHAFRRAIAYSEG